VLCAVVVATYSLSWAVVMPDRAKQNVAVELFYNGVWNDVAALSDVYEDTPITIVQGGGEEGAAPRPCRITFALANDDDRYRPSNPLSPLYGLVGRNTPCRVKVNGTVRGVGEASFAPDQTDDFRRTPLRGKAWVDVSAAGLLQRIGQWSEPLYSPFRQYNEKIAAQSVGYWSGEQARGTSGMISSTPGTNPGNFDQDFSPDSQQRPPGSGPLIDLGENGEVGGYFIPNGTATSTAGWQLSWVARYGALVTGDQDVFDWETTDRTGYGLYLNPNGTLWLVASRNGVSVIDAHISTFGYDFSKWTLFSIDAQYNSGTGVTTLFVNYRNDDDTAGGFASASFSGVPASLRWWDLSRFSGVPSGSTFGHVIGFYGSSLTATQDLFSPNRRWAWAGYVREQATVRFGRLCDQRNVPYYVSSTTSALMGPQGVATFSEHLQEIAATDDALIFDYPLEARLLMLTGNDRMNQPVALALNAANNTHLSKPPREVLDDLDPHNIVTASQRDGGDYTVRDDTSVMGTPPPPAGIGEYRQTVDVNVADEDSQLPNVASWWLAKGTNPRPRFPTVVVDLVAAPALIPAVEAVGVGEVITIANYREYLIRLHVLGWTETIGTHTRTVAFTCAPDDVYTALTLDGGGRLAAVSTTLNAAIAAGDTTLVLKMTNPDERWRPGNNAVPVTIGGEDITLGTVGAVTGSGPWTQTVTGCTRAVNGVSKDHAAGDAVVVRNAIRLTMEVS